MKNKTRRLAAFLLSAAVVITAVPGMQERVYAQKKSLSRGHIHLMASPTLNIVYLPFNKKKGV